MSDQFSLDKDFLSWPFHQQTEWIMKQARDNGVKTIVIMEAIQNAIPTLAATDPTAAEQLGQFVEEVTTALEELENLESSGTDEDLSRFTSISRNFLDPIPANTKTARMTRSLRNFQEITKPITRTVQAATARLRSRTVETFKNSEGSDVASTSTILMVREDDVIRQIMDLSAGLMYKGFDTVQFRETFLARFDLQFLVKCLTTYIYVGNNYTEKLDRVVDSGMGLKIKRELEKAGFDVRKNRQDSTTLSRVAVSFAPMLLWIRRLLESKGKLPASNIKGCNDMVKCDLALSGHFGKDPDYITWYLNFAEVLNSADRKSQRSQEEARTSAKQYLTSAVNCQAADPNAQKAYEKSTIEDIFSELCK